VAEDLKRPRHQCKGWLLCLQAASPDAALFVNECIGCCIELKADACTSS